MFRIRIHKIRKYVGFPDPLVRGCTDPDPDPYQNVTDRKHCKKTHVCLPPVDGPYHGDFPADMYATFVDEIPVKEGDTRDEEDDGTDQQEEEM